LRGVQLHKSHVHAEEGIQTPGKSDTRHILIVGTSLIAALVLLFLISTVFKSGGSDGGSAQAVPADSSDADNLTVIEDGAPFEEIPEFWLQARALSTGNAGWGPDVVAPFDELWHIRSNAGREFFSSPALVGGVLYFGCNDGYMRAVDAVTGSVKWTFGTVCGICGEPAVDSETVYFGGQDGVVYALDRFSGSKKWSAGLGYHVFCNTAILSDTLIVTGNSMGKVCALDARSGEPVWDDDIGGIVLGPVVVDCMVVFSSEGGDIVAFDHEGEQLWSRDYTSQASPPSADATGVYAGFSNGVVRKFSPRDGHVIWETDIVTSTSRCVLARPVIAGNMILTGTNDGQLVSLAASDGSVLWRQRFENWLQLPPAVGQGLVYIACDDQRLHIVDLATGTKVDSLEMDGYSGTAPLLCSGVLYFGNTSGDFIALGGTVPEVEPPDTLIEQPDTLETGEETIEQPDTLETGEETIEQPDTPETVEETIEMVPFEETIGGMIQPLPGDRDDESEKGTDSTEGDDAEN